MRLKVFPGIVIRMRAQRAVAFIISLLFFFAGSVVTQPSRFFANPGEKLEKAASHHIAPLNLRHWEVKPSIKKLKFNAILPSAILAERKECIAPEMTRSRPVVHLDFYSPLLPRAPPC